jgi:alpha-beta hydrolase superfamily lysophospholipase
MPDGTPLPATMWLPPGKVRATLVGMHSFGDTRAAFSSLAAWALARNYAIVAYDQRGFGEARQAVDSNGIVWRGTQTYVADLRSVLNDVRKSLCFQDSPLILVGESMGAAVALVAAAQRVPGVDGLIAAGPAVLADIRNRQFWFGLARTLAWICPFLRYPVVRTKAKLTETAHHRYRFEESIEKSIRADTHVKLSELCDRASNAAPHVKVPTLILYGLADDIIQHRSVTALERDLNRQSIVRRFHSRPHLILQSEERADIERSMEEFIEARIAAFSARAASSKTP